MLVLGRRRNEKVVFPHLGVTVEILNITGNSVRIGIQAPPDVKVLRQELIDRGMEDLEAPVTAAGQPLTRTMQARLRTVALALGLAQKELACGLSGEAGRSLEEAMRELARIDRELSLAARPATTPGQRILRQALLVEDNPNEGKLLAKYLERSGFHVDIAHDGCAALDYLSSHARPDIVLLDMLMPRCDGPSTIRQIRKNRDYADMKVLAVSGMAPSEFHVPIGPDGVDEWVAKPIDPDALVEEINRIVPAPAAA
jgi:carbon storage regulator CsrA